MSIPASPPRLPPSLPAPEASAGVTAASDAAAAANLLDFLVISSRADFRRPLAQFDEVCRVAGVQGEVICIEDLPGSTAGDKLAGLHQLNAARLASGAITSSTIKIVLLHGGPHAPPADVSVDRFREACLGPDASPAPGPAHYLSADRGNFGFPTDLFDAALRKPLMTDGQPEAGFAETIIYGACASGLFREAASATGGSYVLGSGKKSVFREDFNAALAAVVREQGERKRQQLPPMSGRDCWNVMRQLSGEHVSLVGKGRVEVHKIPLSLHGEPVLAVRTAGTSTKDKPEAGAQAIRTLFAKALHGSAASLKQVIDRWGPALLSADHGAVIPGVSLWSVAGKSTREAEQKVRLLIHYAPDSVLQGPLLEDLLKSAIEQQWTAVLAESLTRMAAADPVPLPLEEFVIGLRKMPLQTELLMKLCRRSRDLSYALGDYLARIQREAPAVARSGPFALPPFFADLAKKSEERLRKAASQ